MTFQNSLGMEEIKKMVLNFDKGLSVENYSSFNSGIMNSMYSVKTNKKDFIVRICNPQFDFAKLEKEVLVYDLVKMKTDIPIPKIYFTDFSKQEFPFKYAFFEVLPGRNMDVEDISIRGLENIFEKLGDYMGQLNSLKFNQFGDLYKKGKEIEIGPIIQIQGNSKTAFPGPFKNYGPLFSTNVDLRLSRLKGGKFEDYVPLIGEVVEKKKNVFGKIEPLLIHGDFKPSNIMIYKENVSGVIDFEWAIAGNAEESFIKTQGSFFSFKSNLPEKEKLNSIYTQNYRNYVSELEDQKEREGLYKLAHLGSIMGCYDQYIPLSEQKDFENYLKKEADSLLREI